MRIMRPSTRPPMKPAVAPQITPMTRLTRVAVKPTMQRDLAAIERAHEQVAAVAVGAEAVAQLEIRRRSSSARSQLISSGARSPRYGATKQANDDEAEDDQAGDGGLVAQEAVPRIGPQAAALDLLARLAAEDVGDGHGSPQSYRTLGSSTPYSRSAIRLQRMMSAP